MSYEKHSHRSKLIASQILKYDTKLSWNQSQEQGSPYPEVTDAILQSSLTQVVPIAWVYSTIPPVLVCGTVSYVPSSDGFLGSRNSQTQPRRAGVIGRRLAQTGDLPPALNASRFTRPVNADALVFRLSQAAIGLKESFPTDMTPVNRG